MKTFFTLTGIAAAALIATSAHAGETMEQKFAAIDANGDGVITEAEYVAHKSEYARKSFAKMAGDDGQLTLEEAKAHKKKAHKKHKKEKKEKRDG